MCRILVVEDAQIVREPLARLLVSEGFDVSSAADGNEAMAVLDSHPVDLILLDVLMPRMDGVKFLSVLRGHERFKGVAVVVVTGISDTTKLTLLRELGVSAIVHKVRFSFDGLVDEIRRVMSVV
jgi:two-component system sensor histidine kinase and response regulator WspE